MNKLRQTISASLPVLFLVGCWWLYVQEAELKRFFGGADLASNLLPIVHYRYSIFQEHTLPHDTHLWYGGRPQWMNPLWSFYYLPATVVWLALPLDWGARVVLGGHLLAAVLAAWYLTGVLLPKPPERALASLLLVSPITVTLMLGHVEKLMAWPWVLLGLRALLQTKTGAGWRGLTAGASLSMIALAGSNYYVLYTAILYAALILATCSRRLLAGFGVGALPGLLHVPSVLHLIGVPRGDPADNHAFIISSVQALKALFVGPIEGQAVYESFALIGMATPVALLIFGVRAACARRFPCEATAMLIAALIAALLATAFLYQCHALLDTFRITSRALAFAALALVVATLLCVRADVDRVQASSNGAQARADQARWPRRVLIVLLALAVVQAAPAWWSFRPKGSDFWLDNSGAAGLAEELKRREATSVWINNDQLDDDLIYLALNERGIAIPNTYYGHMGQKIFKYGNICGYSFDTLIYNRRNKPNEQITLHTATWPHISLGNMPYEDLEFEASFILPRSQNYIYNVICPNSKVSQSHSDVYRLRQCNTRTVRCTRSGRGVLCSRSCSPPR